MARQRRLLVLIAARVFVAACAAASEAAADVSASLAPAPASQPASSATSVPAVPLPRIPEGELPPAVRTALEAVEDGKPNFDNPGYYALLAFVHQMREVPGWRNGTVDVQRWRDMLERPAEFRGRAVTIDGIIGFKRPPYKMQDYPQLDELWQLELRDAADTNGPLSATVVCTQDASSLPIGAEIRITGYFVMLRQWQSQPAKYAVLLVAKGPSHVSTAGPPAPASFPWSAVLIVIGVGLLAALVLLRGATVRRTRTDLRTLRARAAPGESHVDELQAWFDAAGRNEQPPDADEP